MAKAIAILPPKASWVQTKLLCLVSQILPQQNLEIQQVLAPIKEGAYQDLLFNFGVG